MLGNYKKVLLPLVIILVLAGTYYKGRQNALRSVERKSYRERERVQRDTEKEREKVRDIADRITEDTNNNPVNDKRDSCIFSNDPFTTDCLK